LNLVCTYKNISSKAQYLEDWLISVMKHTLIETDGKENITIAGWIDGDLQWTVII
jgi:hypothetical protein